MKKYILILIFALTSIINANAWRLEPIDATNTQCNPTTFQTFTSSTSIQTITVYFRLIGEAGDGGLFQVSPSPNSTYTVTDMFLTQHIVTYTFQYLQETGTGIILGGGSCGRRVSIKVAIPAGFKGVFDVRAQNGGTTNLSTLSGSRRCYIGVQNVSKVYSVVTSVGSFTANSSPNIQYTAPTYPTTFFTTSSNLTYSVNLPNTSALTTGTFYLNAFDYVDNIQTITPSALRTFTLGAAGTTTITSVTVKAYDNSSTTTYTCRYIVAATPPVTLSNNCTLTNLTTSVGTLTPTFATTQTTYTITLPYLTTLPTTLTTANFSYSLPTGATISSSTTAILTATNSVSTLTFVVRAEDNVTTKTYRIIYKLTSPDNNANLASLSSSQGTLSPAFSPNTQIYTVTLPFGVAMDNSLLVATTQSSFATITTNTISGNSKVVAVKAQAGNTKSYRVDYSNAPDPTLSVHENSFNETVVYPNPTKDKLFIKSEHAIKKVLIYDNNGKVVVKQNTHEVDIKHLPAGVYYIEINQSKNKTKIIKE